MLHGLLILRQQERLEGEKRLEDHLGGCADGICYVGRQIHPGIRAGVHRGAVDGNGRAGVHLDSKEHTLLALELERGRSSYYITFKREAYTDELCYRSSMRTKTRWARMLLPVWTSGVDLNHQDNDEDDVMGCRQHCCRCILLLFLTFYLLLFRI